MGMAEGSLQEALMAISRGSRLGMGGNGAYANIIENRKHAGVRTKSWTMPIGRVFVYTPAD